jgi:DNA modification methylase
MDAYDDFLKAKVRLAEPLGFEVDESRINPALKPHQCAMVKWMVEGGRRALFAAFGLGKSVMQLEAMRLICEHTNGRALIVCPLGVRQEFIRDAKEILGWLIPPKFIRSIKEADATGIYLTNYETVRDGKLDPHSFTAASLDEAGILRGFGGTKTFREFMALFAGDDRRDGSRTSSEGLRYRFVATATPSPNEYIELLAYAAFLGVMDVGQGKTRFFKRDSTKADNLTIHPHKEREFWLWVASWALFVQKPSDLGFSDDGYALPPLDVQWHEVPTNHRNAGHDRDGQAKMFRDSAIGLQDAAAEKRSSMTVRIAKVLDLVPRGQQSVVWCDLNDEQKAIEKALGSNGITFSSLTGSQDLEDRETLMQEWRNRETGVILTKPTMYGAGVNLQQACVEIFAGIGFKFCDLIQAIHRVHRFGQTNPCTIHLIFTEAERGVRKTLECKWQQHETLVEEMTKIIKEFGLSKAAMAQTLIRTLGVERVEVKGSTYTLVNNDCVDECRRMEENSVGLVLTSIPFGNQYEYSPRLEDFGHTDDVEHFFAQMDFLIPELKRVLMPGRIAAIHVKDRITPGGVNGLGFQTVAPLHVDTINAFIKHGFGYMGMKTIVTDVVRENNQTYRLGWSEQCRDGSKMGVGMPEYLLLFRKPQTDTTKSYADKPVKKKKPDCFALDADGKRTGEIIPFKRNNPIVKGTGYSRARWQMDAHGFDRSSGNRLLDPKELLSLSHADIFKLFREFSLGTVYDFEHHVRIGEIIDEQGRLPVTFMLLQPQSWSDEVWTDITRMLTLNGSQSSKGKEMHLCPMQFDLADRVIEKMSMPGETVLDPFSGLGTVPYRAILRGRNGYGIELSPPYFIDSCSYCKAAEEKMRMPELFDLQELQPEEVLS